MREYFPAAKSSFVWTVYADVVTACIVVVVFRQRRQELMIFEEESSVAAISRVEEQARMQVLQQRVESEKETESPSPSPLVVEAPEVVLKSQTKPPKSEAHASEEKEKVLLKVQNKAGNCQSIRIFTVSKSMYQKHIYWVDIVMEITAFLEEKSLFIPLLKFPYKCRLV